MPPPTDLCELFAESVSLTRYEHLPADAVAAAKKSILDTLGVILAASGMEPAVRAVVDLAIEAGGKPEATVLGFGARLPAPAAAGVNGAMAHCLDFDDRTARGAHSASSMIPAVFAVAQRKGGISGKQLIAAVAAGQDLFIRLRCHVGSGAHWNLSTVLGVFSATAAAAHVLGLGREQIANAMSIASMQASGTMQLVYGGAQLRGMYAGFSANTAVTAALLAQKGLTGIQGVFEGKAGIFNAFFSGQYDREQITANLGREYCGAEMVYKPWPVVGLAHTYIHATLELMKQHGLAAADIEQIRVFTRENIEQLCTPLETRRTPPTAVDAKFSLPFCIALAATRGQVRLGDFTPAALKDPEVLAMAQRVSPMEEGGSEWKRVSPVGRVAIVTRDGRTLEKIGEDVPGSPQAPMGWDDLVLKFRDCASAAAAAPSASGIQHVVDLVAGLESLDDATEVIGALA